MASAKGIFIIGAKRTPFCSYGGPLRELPASHIFASAAKDAIREANLDPALIDNTVVGNVNFLSQCDGGKTPRYCGIYSGVPITSPALGVSKAHGTGLQTIINSAVDIKSGSSKLTLTGGTELMSALPMLVRNVRFGTALGAPYKFEDHIQKQMLDSYTGISVQKMEEEIARKYGVSRQEADQFALQSHLKWKRGQECKAFDKELISLTVTIKKQKIIIDKDQLPQPTIQSEDLDKLPALVEDGNIITSGNSSVPADGAAAVLIANEEVIRNHNIRPLARVEGWAFAGTKPRENGVAGLLAVRKLLEEHKLKIDDVDLFEINETLASQALITAKELRLDISKLNVSGGALAMGDPVAATGARMITHLVHQLGQRNCRRGIAATACGAGQGIAILLVKV